jgi:enoyl-CoA hydratase
MMATDVLRCETTEEGVAVITLNRPEVKNALSRQLREDIKACLTILADDADAKVAVLTGAGTTFCAGFDLKELAEGDAAHIFADAEAYHRAVHTFAKPIIAAVNGAALAGGMDLAAMCDLRIAAEEASFGQPQVRMGVPAAYNLIRTVVPEATARRLCLTGARINAAEALAAGLVSAVSPIDQLMDDALTLATQIAASPAAATMKAQFIDAQAKLFGA